MKKEEFYKIQAEAFRDYADKNPERELFPLFNEWAESKDIYGINRHEIWRIARNYRPRPVKRIDEGTEEFVRLSAVLDFLLELDLAYFNKLAEKKKSLDKT
ncbi:MAG: hypothetical protein ABIG46_01415 [Candidatus Omnitrophota bacterium]